MTDTEADSTHTPLFLGRPVLSSWVVVLSLYAAIQLTHPYVGIAHDASLYAAQASRAMEPDRWSNDLFFRFGSQDKYTLFSKITGPVVAVFGVQTGFAILYSLGHLVFASGLWAISQVLFPDRRFAILASLMMALINVPFAGFGSFHIVEPYLTPRLIAIPMSLWAIRFAWESRYLLAVICLAVAGVFHPLYITGPFLCLAGMWLWPKPKFLIFALFVAVLGVGLILGVESFGEKIFGTMDDEWKSVVRTCTAYNFISEWMSDDFVNISVALFVHVLGVWQSPRFRSLCISCIGVIIIALVGSVLAENLHYKLLFQGQPYRALWLPQLLAIPVSLELVRVTWKSEMVPSLTSIFGFLLILNSIHINHSLFASLIGAVIGAILLRSRQPRLGAILGFSAVFCGFRLYEAFGVIVAWLDPDTKYNVFAPALKWLILWNYFGPILKIVVSVMLCVIAQRFRGFAFLLMAISLLTIGLSSRCDGIHQHPSIMQKDVYFVINHLQAVSNSERKPSVYWPSHLGGSSVILWFYGRSETYINDIQSAGVMFNRGTAMEAKRRWHLVMPFEFGDPKKETAVEADLCMRLMNPKGFKTIPGTLQLPKTTQEDLLRLASDRDLDWLITDMNFPELSPISNGSIFIYDMQKLRSERTLSEPGK
ncbi:MAG: hypothetical protein ACRC8S_17715 [Fimbriiglobus sp.]